MIPAACCACWWPGPVTHRVLRRRALLLRHHHRHRHRQRRTAVGPPPPPPPTPCGPASAFALAARGQLWRRPALAAARPLHHHHHHQLQRLLPPRRSPPPWQVQPPAAHLHHQQLHRRSCLHQRGRVADACAPHTASAHHCAPHAAAMLLRCPTHHRHHHRRHPRMGRGLPLRAPHSFTAARCFDAAEAERERTDHHPTTPLPPACRAQLDTGGCSSCLTPPATVRQVRYYLLHIYL